MLTRIIILLCVINLQAPTCSAQQRHSLVNFQHLEHLTEKITLRNEEVSIVHIYSEYPDYKWVAAAESGPEGIACVDDAARAAVVYLRHYELNGDTTSLLRAKSLLAFILNMQADDGQFYNFIFDDHRINTDGVTSHKSFGWWAARAVWALALGYRVFASHDTMFANSLLRALEQTHPHLDSVVARYKHTEEEKGYSMPRWLLYESAADATSELMLGLIEYWRAKPNPHIQTIIEKLAEGIKIMQDGDERTYPYGLHRSWKTIWHMWGNSQTQALAYGGRICSNDKMIASAEREARGFYSRLLIEGFFKEMDVTEPAARVEFEQIAYGVRPMAVGLIRLYEATGKREYLTMAALAASWFFGNNVLNQQMYNPITGRCFDGIRDSLTVNKNSGAESTIEALYTLVELEHYQEALRFVWFQKIEHGTMPGIIYGLFKNPLGEQLALVLDLSSRTPRILEGDDYQMLIRSIKN